MALHSPHRLLTASITSSTSAMSKTSATSITSVTTTTANISTTPLPPIVSSAECRTIRRVLLLDVSGSMAYKGAADKYHRHAKMLQSASDYILNIVEDGTELGVVSFSTLATVLAPMTLVSNVTRSVLVDSLPLAVGGGTSIGSGLLKSLKILKANGKIANSAIILLLTDGEENVKPFIKDVEGNLLQHGVRVDGIAVGAKAELNIGRLSRTSNAYSFFDSESSLSNAMMEAYICSSLNRKYCGDSLALVESTSIRMQHLETINGFVIIDRTIGRDTVFTFGYNNHTSINVILISPSGQVFSNNTKDYIDDYTFLSIRIYVPDAAEVGIWNWTIKCVTGPTVVHFTAKSRNLDPTREKLITMYSWLNVDHYTWIAYGSITVYAEIVQGKSPILGAELEATIDCDNCNNFSIPLMDTGASADAYRNDGVYTGVIPASTMNTDGRYSVRVRYVATANSTYSRSLHRRQRRNVGSSAMGSSLIPVPSFQRVASGGTVVVSGVSPTTQDITPPDKVDSLALEHFDFPNSRVTFSWFAVGDDFMTGLVNHYVLKMASVYTDLTNAFWNATSVPHSWMSNCPSLTANLTSKAGSKEFCTIRLPQRGEKTTYVFAIVAVDEADNVGPLSPALQFMLLEKDPSLVSLLGNPLSWIIAISVCLFLLLAALAGDPSLVSLLGNPLSWIIAISSA